MKTPPIIVSISGEPKSGKTHFCCTAPAPIRFFDFDQGSEAIIGIKFPDAEIVASQHFLDVWGKEKTLPIWKDFETQYKEALRADNGIQTIVIDTATQLWEVLRLAHFERVQAESGTPRKRLQPVEYAEPNSLMKAVIIAARAAGKNLIITHYIREVYDEDGKRTGRYEPDQFKSTNGLADIILTIESRKRKGTSGQDAIVTIQGNRFDREVVGVQLTNPTFADIATAAGL